MRSYVDASVLFLFSPAYFRDHYDEVRQYCDQGASGRSDPAIMAKRIDMILNFNQKHRLGEMRHPCLVLVGRPGHLHAPRTSRRSWPPHPRGRDGGLEGGHLVYWEKPEEFYSRVLEFLREH